MKSNKSFLRVFLALVMAFVFSFCVNAKGSSEDESCEKVEQLIERLGVTEEELEECLGTKEKFENEIKSGLKDLEKHIKETEVIKKKIYELFKKLDEASKDSVFREILSLSIEYFKKVLENINGGSENVDSNSYGKDRDDDVDQANKDIKKIIINLEYLKRKDRLNDEDKEYIKVDLKRELGIFLEEDMKYYENVKEKFNELNYEDVKKWARKTWPTRFINKIKMPLLVGFVFLIVVLLILLIVKFIFMKSNKNKKVNKN